MLRAHDHPAQPVQVSQVTYLHFKQKAMHGIHCVLAATLLLLAYALQPNPIPAAAQPYLQDYYKCLLQPDRVTGSGAGCYSCVFSDNIPSSNIQKCFACITAVSSNPAGQGASYCSACWGKDVEDSTKCQQCLEQAGQSDASQCV